MLIRFLVVGVFVQLLVIPSTLAFPNDLGKNSTQIDEEEYLSEEQYAELDYLYCKDTEHKCSSNGMYLTEIYPAFLRIQSWYISIFRIIL